MTSPKNILSLDYTYELPENRIAKFPVQPKDNSKLLIYRNGNITESTFINVAEFIEPGSLLIMNNTRVLQARLIFEKESGGKIEVFCLKPKDGRLWHEVLGEHQKVDLECLIGGISKWKTGLLEKKMKHNHSEIILYAQYKGDLQEGKHVELSWNGALNFAEVLNLLGETPLPPYLQRKAERSDKETYQTYYAEVEGSVAAPTAGLHFTKNVFDKIEERQIKKEFITLHVGAGTFRPIKSDKLGDHEMHSEWIHITSDILRTILRTKGKIITVGTTSLRLIESIYWLGVLCIENKNIHIKELQLKQWDGYDLKSDYTKEEAIEALLEKLKMENVNEFYTTTQILIAPGYQFKITEALITNFHQPGSTLLLLIAAIVGNDWKKIYNYALGHDFRFLSYGDSSLLWMRSYTPLNL